MAVYSENFSVNQLVLAKTALTRWYASKKGGGLEGVALKEKVNRVMRNQFGDSCDALEIKRKGEA
jgi:hypothetical protein